MPGRSNIRPGGESPVYPASGVLERTLDLLFPPICVTCRRVGRWICARCWETVQWMYGEACGRCGIASAENPCTLCADAGSPLRTVVAVANFEGTAREAVHALKYEGRYAIASTLGRLLAGAAHELAVDCVAPVPLHAARRRERGYDQAELLARTAARTLRVPLNADALVRVRRTKQQVSLGLDARRENVAGAFVAARSYRGQTVLLVDDVYTTGATLHAAAGALLEAGASSVVAAAFARASLGTDDVGAARARRPMGSLRRVRSIR